MRLAKALMMAKQGLHPYTKIFVDAMTVKPSDERIVIINNLVVGLVKNNLWNIFDCFYLFRCHDAQAARINLINPGNLDLQVVGSPSFVPVSSSGSAGYYGQSGGYLRTVSTINNFSKFTQNNSHLGIYHTGPGLSSPSNETIIGSQNLVNEIRTSSALAPSSLAVVNSAYNASESIRTFGYGHRIVSRPDSNTYRHIGNGVQLGVDVSRASSVIAANDLRICGGISGIPNLNYAEIAHAGSNISVTDSLILYNLLSDYRNAYI